MDNEYSEKHVNHNYARDIYFYHLFSGNYYQDIETLLEEGRSLELKLSSSRYLAVQFHPERWGSVFEKHGPGARTEMIRDIQFVLRNTLEEYYRPQGFRAFATEYRGDTVCLLLPPDDMTDPVQIARARTQEAVEFFEEQLGLSVTAAISRVKQTPMKIHQACIETERVFEYVALVSQDAPVAAYDELSPPFIRPDDTSGFLKLEGRLLACIRESDFEGARVVVHEMFSRQFRESRPSIDNVRLRIYGTVNCVYNMMEEIHDVIDEELFAKLDYGRRLGEAETLDDILLETDRILDIISNQTEKKDAPPPWVTQVRTYIDKNYQDVNVSVSFVADRFNISPSYCSRVFKEYMGVGVFDYIQKRRLAEAKHLIRHANLPVRTIAEQAGFSSALTMNRAFKRYEGSSPSQFKAQL